MCIRDSPLPDFVIDAACAGNAEAVERVLQHYDGYINKLCTRTLYDGCLLYTSLYPPACRPCGKILDFRGLLPP